MGFQGPWVGWGHHRWLVEVTGNRIEFVMKHHVMHGRETDHFPSGFRDALTPEERVVQLWWEGSFEFGERVMTGAEELDHYLAEFVSRELERRGAVSPVRQSRGRRWRRGLSR